MINKHSVSLQYFLKKRTGNNDTELREVCMHTSSMADIRERSTSIFTLSETGEPPYFNMDNEPTY